MKIELIERNKDESIMSFSISGVTPAFVNTLRRIILESVPTLAIESVVFKKNGSVLYDEILANRLGLVPVLTDLKTYVLPDVCECKGEGCAQCTVKATLEKVGPCTVYSGDLKFDDPSVKVVHDEIPLVKLLDGQELSIEATAILGRGKEHVKWSPGHCHYKYAPKITIGKVDDVDAVVKACPRNLFKAKGSSLELSKDAPVECNLCGACADASSGIRLNESPDEFIFTVETWKQLQIKEVMTQALKELDMIMDSFSTEVEKLG